MQARLGRPATLVVRTSRTLAEVGEEWLAAQTPPAPAHPAALPDGARPAHLPAARPRGGSQTINPDRIAALIARAPRAGPRRLDDPRHPRPARTGPGYAARRRLIPDNPMRRLERGERPHVVRREMRILRPDEIDALLRAARRAYRPILATAIFTGLRQGELLGLPGQTSTSTPESSTSAGSSTAPQHAQPKTPQALRDVILMPSLATLLREHKLASAHCAAWRSGLRDAQRAADALPERHPARPRRGDHAGRDSKVRASRGCASTISVTLLCFAPDRQGLNVVFVSRQLGHASPGSRWTSTADFSIGPSIRRRASDGLEAGFSRVLAA